MGASSWEYVVPYQEDLGAALAALRRQVFEQGDYVKPSDGWDLPDPGSLEDLMRERYWEFMGNCGTHSIIDVFKIAPADFDPDDYGDEFGTIRPLSEAEYVQLFGVARPGRAEYTPLAGKLDRHLSGERWTGRAAVLWSDGTPAEIVFWGFSGD